MKQTDDDIRIFAFFHLIHPFLSRLHHLFKAQTAPQIFAQPVGNRRCEQTDNSDFHAFSFKNSIRLEVGFAVFGVQHIGTQHRTMCSFYPFIINGMPRFYIVIAHRLCIITHIINNRSRNICKLRTHIIIIIRGRLSLKNIATIKQQQIFTIALAERFHIVADASHRPL